MGQLISEVKGDVTRTYTYDNAGNIVSIEETKPRTILPPPGFDDNTHWALTPTQTTTNTLSYTNSQWGDLLTSYNGTAITYDGIGNPLSYYNGTSYTFTWEGRRLVGAVKGAMTMSFAYNDEGIRTSKTVNGVTTTYYVNGGQIIAEKTDTRTIVYIYDASGSPIGMMYRTPSYAANTFDVFWYEKNLQGDIIGVCNSEGDTLISYNYSDAWGNHTVSYASVDGITGAQYNPFRYRGYYYDTDLGMYYLQSRYYDAKICRFISADSYTSTGQGILGNNMFAYCGNNPVMGYDPTGYWGEDALKQIFNNIVYPACEMIEYVLSYFDGTLSIGGAVTISIGVIVINYQYSLAIDTSGNMVWQYTQGGGLGAGIGASLTFFAMTTNAPSVDDLLGTGYQSGGSISDVLCIGGDRILIPGKDKKRVYTGSDINIGVSSPGFEVHIIRGETINTSGKANIFEIIREFHKKVNGV